MLESYDSQGGMAPPRLILMKNHQVLGSENYFSEVTTGTKNDCIAIWTTKGISSIDEWNSNITRFKGAYEDKAEIDVGSRKAEMYTVSSAKRSNFIAFLKVNNLDGGTSYFFHTCNTHNKTDFVDVIRSLKLKADINQHK